jgi:hypothetical protein
MSRNNLYSSSFRRGIAIEHEKPVPDPDVIYQERPEGSTDDEADGSIAGACNTRGN